MVIYTVYELFIYFTILIVSKLFTLIKVSRNLWIIYETSVN